jgi:glycosyltransferase involved in cell wall biosynthesis
VKKILIVSGDILPLPGFPTSGAGLRAWGLGQGLRANGFEVGFAMPIGWKSTDLPLPPLDFEVQRWHPYNLKNILQDSRPEAVLFCHWPAVQIKRRLDVPTIIDFHGPHALERAFQGLEASGWNSLQKIDALRKADFFLCAGEKQKAYFLAWLLISGFDLKKETIASVPVCLSPELPLREPNQEQPILVYGGVYLPWQDPTAGLLAAAETLEKEGLGELKLFGGRHPFIPLEVPPVFKALEDRLKRFNRVSFEGIRPHDELVSFYARATAAVDLMAFNYERELAFTTRTVEYLWCGLPVIHNDFDELAGLIREYDAGWVLDPEDHISLQTTISAILRDPERVNIKSRNAQALVKDRLTWDKAVKPLVDFLKDPQKNIPGEGDLASMVAQKIGKRNFWDKWSSVKDRNMSTLVQEARALYREEGARALAQKTLAYFRRRLS